MDTQKTTIYFIIIFHHVPKKPAENLTCALAPKKAEPAGKRTYSAISDHEIKVSFNFIFSIKYVPSGNLT